MEVKDGLPCTRAVVHDETVVCQPLPFGHLPGGGEEMADERLVVFLDGVGTRDRLARDDEDVDGRSRVEVPEGDAAVVFVDEVARELAVSDLLKQGLFAQGGRG